MRLFTRQEFEKFLIAQWGLEKTDEKTATTQVWRTQTGQAILVPIITGRNNPDYLLDEVQKQIARIESEDC